MHNVQNNATPESNNYCILLIIAYPICLLIIIRKSDDLDRSIQEISKQSFTNVTNR